MNKAMLAIVAAGAAVSLTACGSGKPALAPASHVPTSAATYTLPAGPLPSPSPTPTESPIQQWWDDSGQVSWDTVANDLSQIQTDSADNNLAAVEQDGIQAKNDAVAAEQDGPPAGTDDPAYYFAAMAAIAFAGVAMEFGNFTLATTYMQTASSKIQSFEAEALSEGLTIS